MSDPVLTALADTQRRLAAALDDVHRESIQRHRVERLLDSAHRMIADQHQLIEDLGGRPAESQVAA